MRFNAGRIFTAANRFTAMSCPPPHSQHIKLITLPRVTTGLRQLLRPGCRGARGGCVAVGCCPAAGSSRDLWLVEDEEGGGVLQQTEAELQLHAGGVYQGRVLVSVINSH